MRQRRLVWAEEEGEERVDTVEFWLSARNSPKLVDLRWASTCSEVSLPSRKRLASDAELLDSCLAADETAWKELVQRYQGLVFSTAIGVGLTSDDAGDVFQEVWAELFRSLRRIRNPDSLPRWLLVATRRLSWKVAVRNRRMSPEIPPDLVDPWALADETMEFLESRARIEVALRELGPPCNEVIRLMYLENPPLDYRQAAQRLGIAMGSVGPARLRCIEKLRKILMRRR